MIQKQMPLSHKTTHEATGLTPNFVKLDDGPPKVGFDAHLKKRQHDDEEGEDYFPTSSKKKRLADACLKYPETQLREEVVSCEDILRHVLQIRAELEPTAAPTGAEVEAAMAMEIDQIESPSAHPRPAKPPEIPPSHESMQEIEYQSGDHSPIRTKPSSPKATPKPRARVSIPPPTKPHHKPRPRQAEDSDSDYAPPVNDEDSEDSDDDDIFLVPGDDDDAGIEEIVGEDGLESDVSDKPETGSGDKLDTHPGDKSETRVKGLKLSEAKTLFLKKLQEIADDVELDEKIGATAVNRKILDINAIPAEGAEKVEIPPITAVGILGTGGQGDGTAQPADDKQADVVDPVDEKAPQTPPVEEEFAVQATDDVNERFVKRLYIPGFLHI
jgi:hypothetical protein